jgi:hypothetical protein
MGEAEKRVLVELMLDITNDWFQNQDKINGEEAWQMISDILKTSGDVHREQLIYWAMEEETDESCFAISKYVRAFLKRHRDSSFLKIK